MNDMNRTSIYVAVAGVLFVAAFFTSVTTTNPEVFDDQGQAFFPEFKDFSQATSMEVWDFDADRGEAIPFKVELRDGLWRIPSKDDYPADAGDRLAKAAAQVMNLVRTTLRTTQESDQASLGVVDPAADASKPTEGRGRRITLRDAKQQVLADVIVGKEVEDQQGQRYVRVPSEKRVYAAEVDFEISTKFADWIQTDLLDLGTAAVSSVTIDAYKVDEGALRQGMIHVQGGDTLALEQRDGAWHLAGQTAEQEVAKEPVTKLTDTLRELEIVDVLPRSKARLEQAGFFVTQEGIYSNEGEMRVDLDTGVEYVLRFGEVLPGDDGEGLRRFVVINAKLEPKAMKTDDADARKRSEEKVAQLNKRFNDWYYVISAKSFDALRPKREALLQPKGTDAGKDGEGTGFDEPGFDEHEGHGHEGDDHGTAPVPGAPFPPLAPSELEPAGPAGPGPVGPPGPGESGPPAPGETTPPASGEATPPDSGEATPPASGSE